MHFQFPFLDVLYIRKKLKLIAMLKILRNCGIFIVHRGSMFVTFVGNLANNLHPNEPIYKIFI